MAMTNSSDAGALRGSARWSAVYAAGMLAVFIGERAIGTGKSRLLMTVLGLVLVIASMVGRIVRAKKANPDRRQVEHSLLRLYALGLLAVVVYFVQSDVPTLRGGKPLEHSWPKLATALGALWPAIWITAAWPIALVEMAYANMARAPHLEVRRVRDALLSGLGIAFALIFAFSVAWVTSERDKKVDLAYFRTTRPGEATRKIVRALDQPVEVATFFPAGNEVREELANYFADLSKESSQLSFHQYDFDIDPQRAHELTVTTNGTVVVSRNGRKEMIQVPVQFETARNALKTLDKEVQQRLLTVVKPKRVVLFTQGHNERWFEHGTNDSDQRPGLRDLRELMRDQGYEVRSFGAADGLMTDAPKDATMVMIIGPKKPFEPEEIGTLTRFFDGGGKLFVALDPDNGIDLHELLGPLGVKVHLTPLANEQAFARKSHQDSDHANIVTASFSSHPTMSTLLKLGSRAPLILPGSGWVEAMKVAKPNGVTLDTPMRAQPATFEDKNGNFKKDQGEEQRAFELAAAVTKGAGRAFVIADSDVISDEAIRVAGNGLLALDTVRWLAGDEAYTGQTNVETDVPITHTRKQDVVWFYSSIFLMPVLVVLLGLFVTRRRRSYKKAAAPTVSSSPNQGVAS
jgi:hypothetical protein